MKNFKIFGRPLCFLLTALVCSACSSRPDTPVDVLSTESTADTLVSSETSPETSSETSAAAETSQVAVTTAEKSVEITQVSAKTAKSEPFSDRDLNPECSSVDTEIVLKGSSVSCDGDGVSVENSVITISREGIYKISGTLDDGQIVVNAPDAKVQLILDNAVINCTNSSPIYGADAKKIFITLAENSENTLTDGTNYVYSDTSQTEPDACIFSKDSLTINGSGSLNVNANFKDGIAGNDDIVVTGGDLKIKSVGDGIKAKDYFAICDGNLDIDAGADGIKSTNTSDTSLGFVYAEGGEITVNAVNDGIQAETSFNAVGGTFNVVSGGGSANAQPHQQDNFGGGGGFNRDFGGGLGNENFTPPDTDFTQLAEFDVQTENTDSSTTESVKGVKAGTLLDISGGNFKIDSADDSLHTNGSLSVSGGDFEITAGSKAVHADSEIAISGGNLVISDSYEGIEAGTINVSGGNLDITSSDDGFNASSGTGQQQGGGMGFGSDGSVLNISDGEIYVNAGGDCLDSNGTISITGGTVIVDGPENDGNSSVDCDSPAVIDGGLLVAVGSSGMAETPSADSAQNSVSVGFDTYLDAGTPVTLVDGSGNQILSYSPAKKFSHIIISTPDLQTGESYEIYTGGTVSAENIHGLSESGYGGDGSLSQSFTVESSSTVLGTQGRGGGMMGGHGGRGGMMMSPDGQQPEMPDGMTPPEMPLN